MTERIFLCRSTLHLTDNLGERVIFKTEYTAHALARCNVYIPDEGEGDCEDDGADGAGLALEEEPGEVEHHEDGVVVQQRRVHGLRDQQHRDQPLQAAHLDGRASRMGLGQQTV